MTTTAGRGLELGSSAAMELPMTHSSTDRAMRTSLAFRAAFLET